MWETLWDLIALNWEIFISTICNDLHHASLVLLENLESLFPVMYSSDSTINEFFLNGSLILLVSDMWQLYGIKRVVLLWNEIPDKSKAILRHSFHLVDDLRKAFLRFFCSLLAFVENGCQLIKLTCAQVLDIHHVDVGSAVIQLFLAVDHVRVQLFYRVVSKCLGDRAYQGLEAHWEARTELV